MSDSNLPTPIMAADRLGIADSYLGHVYDAREGARGAKSGGGVVVVAISPLRMVRYLQVLLCSLAVLP